MTDPFAELEAMVEDLDIAGHLREVKELDNAALVHRYGHTKEKLKALGELVEARTDEGRDLHSEHTAILDELRERGLR
jgi:hypothetical protein